MRYEVKSETERGKVMVGDVGRQHYSGDNAFSVVSEHHINIWPFHDAPLVLQELCNQGGDEEFIIFVPRHFQNDTIQGTCQEDFSFPWQLEALWSVYVVRPEMWQFDNGLVITWTHA
jgi:hypothetical protein